MKSIWAVRVLFIISGLYDGILGIVFFLASPAIFNHYGIPQPNHPGYVQFSALLLVIFALMFFAVAAKPYANRNLIPYGILLKLSYSGTVFCYWAKEGVPGLWKPFAFIDLVFVVMFVWGMRASLKVGAAD